MPFTVLPNRFLQDEKLTWEERGMLSDLLSRKEDFEVNVSGLAKLGGKTRAKIYKLLERPIALGYVVKKELEERAAFEAVLYEVYSLCAEDREKLAEAFKELAQKKIRSNRNPVATCIKIIHTMNLPCIQIVHR